MAGQGASAAKRIKDRIRTVAGRYAPFQAAAISVSSGIVTIQEPGDDEEPFLQGVPAVRGASIAAGDTVLILPIGDGDSWAALGAVDDGAPWVLSLPGQVAATGGKPTVTRATAAGSTASTAGQTAGTDTAGVIELVPGGSGIAAGVQLTVTFAQSRANGWFTVHLQPMTTAARTAGNAVGPVNRSSSGFSLTSDIALSSGSTYRWGYAVLSYPG